MTAFRPPDGENMKPPVIIQNPESPIPAEIIAQSIIDLAKAAKILSTTRLTRRAIVTLIHDNSCVGRRDIEMVLNNLEALEETWLKPIKKP